MNSAAFSFRFSRRLAAPRRLVSSRAFTLIEVTLAAGVLALAIATSITTLMSGFRALDTARCTTIAAQIIQSEMERIRLLSWDGASPVGVNNLPASATLTITDIFPGSADIAARFVAARTTADVAGMVGDMKRITVTVTWKGIDGVPHSRNSTTHYCQNGLYDYYYTLSQS